MAFEIGQRVDTDKGRGSVAYVGETSFASGVFVGVVLDTASGKNNGTIDGKTYFECQPNHGLFLRPNGVRPEGTPRTSIPRPNSGVKLRASPQTTPSGSSESLYRSSRQPSMTKILEKSHNTTGNETTPSGSNESIYRSSRQASMTKIREQNNIENDPLNGGGIVVDTKSALLTKASENELNFLRAQVKDLNEKLQILKEKRREDVSKLNEIPVLTQKNAQLMATNASFNEKYAALQREYDELKAEYHKTKMKLESLAGDSVEPVSESQLEELLTSAVEAREMMEWQNEQLVAQVDELRNRIRELEQPPPEVKPKAKEGETKTGDAEGDLYGFSPSEYRETIMELYESLQKSEQEKKVLVSKIESLVKETELANEVIVDMQVMTEEYKEIANAASQAERICEELVLKNLDLEERYQICANANDDFFSLNALFNEFAQYYNEDYKTYLSEIEAYQFKLADSEKEKDIIQEALQDAKDVIERFKDKLRETFKALAEQRDVNHRLQEELQIRDNDESDKQLRRGSLPKFDVSISDRTQAFGNLVKGEVAAIEVSSLKEQLKSYELFLPQTFSDDDRDLIYICHSFSRISRKTKLLEQLIARRYPPVPGGVRREHVLSSTSAELWANDARFSFYLRALYAITAKLDSMAQSSRAEDLHQLVIRRHDIDYREKILNQFFDFIKHHPFDELVSYDNVIQSVSNFQQISTHISNPVYDTNKFIADTNALFRAGCEWVLKEIERLELSQIPAEAMDMDNPFTQFLNDMHQAMDDLKALILRSDNSIDEKYSIKIDKELISQFFNSFCAIDRLGRGLNTVNNLVGQQISLMVSMDGVESETLLKLLRDGIEQQLGKEVATDMYETLREYARTPTECYETLTAGMSNGQILMPREKLPTQKLRAIHDRIAEKQGTEEANRNYQREIMQHEAEQARLLKMLKEFVTTKDADLVRADYSSSRAKQFELALVEKNKEIQALRDELAVIDVKYQKEKDEILLQLKEANDAMKTRLTKYDVIRNHGFMDALSLDEHINDVNNRYADILKKYYSVNVELAKKRMLDLKPLKVRDPEDTGLNRFLFKNTKLREKVDYDGLFKRVDRLYERCGRYYLDKSNDTKLDPLELKKYKVDFDNLSYEIANIVQSRPTVS